MTPIKRPIVIVDGRAYRPYYFEWQRTMEALNQKIHLKTVEQVLELDRVFVERRTRKSGRALFIVKTISETDMENIQVLMHNVFASYPLLPRSFAKSSLI